jgi:hypothetical protein
MSERERKQVGTSADGVEASPEGGGDAERRMMIARMRRAQLRKTAGAASNKADGEGEAPKSGGSDMPGRGVSTEFGEFWVVPDDHAGMPDAPGELMTESELSTVQKVWSQLKSGSGSLRIDETDVEGNAFSGFRARVLEMAAKLLSKPDGRRLLCDFLNSGHEVSIRPSSKPIAGGFSTKNPADGRPSRGKPGAGTWTTINVDPSLSETDVKVYDKAGQEIAAPMFVNLAHELIHARHIVLGVNKVKQKARNQKFGNAGEEETIKTGELSENDIRAEHGLPERLGHNGVEKRPEELFK